MFKTLDRYIMRTFLHSLLMWFLVFMMMRIVIDLFVKLDEFTENIDQGGGLWITISSIASHYFYHSFVYFTEMGGIVIVASAVFAVARMNHTNELTAMLASGVSLHRVVWPIIVAAILFGALIVIDQEVIIPNISRRLTLEEDEVQVGKSKFEVRAESDENFNKLLALCYDPKTGQLDRPMVIFRSDRKGHIGDTYGKSASYGEFEGKKGWFLKDAQLRGSRVVNSTGKRKIYRNWTSNQSTKSVKTKISPEFLFNFGLSIFKKENPGKVIPRKPDGTYPQMKFPNLEVKDAGFDMVLTADLFKPGKQIKVKRGDKIFIETHSGKLTKPVFTYYTDKSGEFAKKSADGKNAKQDKRILAQIVADSANWVYDPKAPGDAHWKLIGAKVFVPSDLDPKELELRDSGTYFSYMSSAKLREIQKANTFVDVHAVRLAMFTRIADPINNVIMLMLGLPFILSRGRNIKMSAALCLLMVGSFYAFIYICRSMGLDDYLSAFLPILIFGPVSLLMLDSIKT